MNDQFPPVQQHSGQIPPLKKLQTNLYSQNFSFIKEGAWYGGSVFCRKEEGHLLTVVMIPWLLDECVLTIKEAEALFREFLAFV